ncbi:MAG: hypothetical protein ACOC78_04015 [Actinomycetota bacterium]
MRVIKCRKCGFPFWFSKIIRWNDNGTISDRFRPDLRTVMIESNIFNELFARIEEYMGISISHLVFEAQRNAAKEVIDSVLNKFPFMLGRVGPNKRIVVSLFCKLAVLTGQSYAKALRYRPGRMGEAIIRNPYNRELMAAIILGAFESLERQPFEHTWKKVDGDDVVSITASDRKPDVSERMSVVLPPLKPGRHPIPRCPSCGMPRELSYLEWREDQGIIIDTRRGVRMTFLDAYTPGVVFREVEKELGKDIYPLIIRAQKEVTSRHLHDLHIVRKDEKISPGEHGDIYRRVLASLPIWGQGNPVDLKHERGFLKVTIDNPYNQHLLAGHLAAIFEALEGMEPEVEWSSPEPNSAVFTLRTP